MFRTAITSAAMALMLVSGTAFAQQAQPNQQQAQGQAQKGMPNIPAGADRVVGKTVIGEKGQQVGEVSDVLVDKNGKVAGLVMQRGETLGVGGKSVIVPWGRFAMQGDQLSLKMTDQEVSQLPSVD